jgi:hypothetical protein
MNRSILGGKRASETRNEVFDFTSSLAAGETISSASTAATVYSGTDANPGVVSGSAAISGAKVTQKLTAGVVGVVYELVCTATTSLGQVLPRVAYLVIAP